MGWRDLRRNWRDTATPQRARASLMARMDHASAASTPADALQRVHDDVRSSTRLHLRVHWLEIRRAWREPGGSRVVPLLVPCVLAPLSSAGRRLGGVAHAAPQDPSLAHTWGRVLRVATQADAEPPRSRVAPPR